MDHGYGPGERQRAAALLRRGQLRAGVAAEWAGPAGGALVLRPRHGLPHGRRQVPGPQGILLLRVGVRLLGGAGEERGELSQYWRSNCVDTHSYFVERFSQCDFVIIERKRAGVLVLLVLGWNSVSEV